jgi:REP element-mobilizing transposase RayT
MLRGIDKQLIFEEPADYTQFLKYLSEVKQISGFKLYAYCLMENHLHLLIREGKEPLSQVFKRIGARYVFWFNWKYGRSGQLFQDRFRSEPVESDEYFLTTLKYIYQNPVVAGLFKFPDEYEWCSRRSLGKNDLIDEAELFAIVPINTIQELEHDEVKDNLLEPKIGRRLAISDEEAFIQMKVLGEIESAADFQSLDRKSQAQVLSGLRNMGVSIRQFSRLSGLSKGVAEGLCRISKDA